MFLTEMDRIKAQLKEIEEKNQIAQQQLEETGKNFETTKAEYEALEEQLEQLDARIESFRQESTRKALLKQQLEGQINVMREQIHAARQSDAQYQERTAALEEERRRRQEEAEKYRQDCGISWKHHRR